MKHALRLTPFIALALTACAGDRDSRPAPSRPTGVASRPVMPNATTQACFGQLQQAGIAFTALPDRDFGGGCTAMNSVRLDDIGTPTSNLGPMTCTLAEKFAGWVRFAVKPAARQVYGEDIVRVETMGTYACRSVVGNRPTTRLSQHAHANAVDVSAFILADGRRVPVLGGWNGDERSQRFLRLVHQSACRRFGTVLSPDYNAAHRDHFHFDMSGQGYCR